MMGSNSRGPQTEWEGHPGVESGEVLVEQRGFYSYTDMALCLAISQPNEGCVWLLLLLGGQLSIHCHELECLCKGTE